MRYSLSDHILSIKFSENFKNALGLTEDSITIGGEGSMVDSFNFSQTNSTWDTSGDATGGYVHNKNLSRVGTCSITINQLSEKNQLLAQLFNIYFNSAYEDDSVTITLSDAHSQNLVICRDCYLNNPALAYGQSAGNRTWTFNVGELIPS